MHFNDETKNDGESNQGAVAYSTLPAEFGALAAQGRRRG